MLWQLAMTINSVVKNICVQDTSYNILTISQAEEEPFNIRDIMIAPNLANLNRRIEALTTGLTLILDGTIPNLAIKILDDCLYVYNTLSE